MDGKSDNQFNDFLYEQSLKIEPRDKTDLPKFVRIVDDITYIDIFYKYILVFNSS